MTKKPMLPRYSGRLSRAFWDRVNALPYGGSRESLYTAGVLLQNLEGSVLHYLRNAENNPGEGIARTRRTLRRQAPKGGGR